jgi:hypothetical protein
MQTCTITAREQHCTPGGSASASAASSHAPPAKGLRGGGGEGARVRHQPPRATRAPGRAHDLLYHPASGDRVDAGA